MSINRPSGPANAEKGEEVVLSAEQIGVRYPDGTIIWSDITLGAQNDNQTIQTSDGQRYLFNHHVDLGLRERDMNTKFADQCAISRVPFSPLVLVKRRIMLALDKAVPML
jgi:hypothetical protein